MPPTRNGPLWGTGSEFLSERIQSIRLNTATKAPANPVSHAVAWIVCSAGANHRRFGAAHWATVTGSQVPQERKMSATAGQSIRRAAFGLITASLQIFPAAAAQGAIVPDFAGIWGH